MIENNTNNTPKNKKVNCNTSFLENSNDFLCANFAPNLASQILESIASFELHLTKTNVKTELIRVCVIMLQTTAKSC